MPRKPRSKNNNNSDPLMICLMIFVVVIILILIFKGSGGFCGAQEKFGQEPSIRTSTGWLAGPSGGNYNPFSQVSSRINKITDKNKYTHPRDRNTRESFSNNKGESPPICKSCLSTEDFDMN
jgi:hypothetical protein